MKVLHLCPLWFPISKDAPGGIETLLAHLIHALVDYCDVSVVATGDSEIPATLLPVASISLSEQMKARSTQEYCYYEQQQLKIALTHADDFDVIHSHIGPSGYVLSAVPSLRSRVLHTIHTPVYADAQWFVRQNPDIWFSAISEFQASKLRQQGAHHCFTIPNGIDPAAFAYNPCGGQSLLFLGRIEAEKGPDIAIKTARALGCPLTLAGPIVHHEFFKDSIEPFLNDRICYLGVLDHAQKNQLLGEAGCLLVPSRWAEPFGMVALEAMACGTPVVALANGALPEIIETGLTGFVTKQEDQLPMLVTKAVQLDRARIRDRAIARFDIRVVTEQHVKLYETIATNAQHDQAITRL